MTTQVDQNREDEDGRISQDTATRSDEPKQPDTSKSLTYFSLRKLKPGEQAEDGEFWLRVGMPGDYAIRQEQVTDLQPSDVQSEDKGSLRRKGQLTQKPPQPMADMQSDTSPKADSNQVDNSEEA